PAAATGILMEAATTPFLPGSLPDAPELTRITAASRTAIRSENLLLKQIRQISVSFGKNDSPGRWFSANHTPSLLFWRIQWNAPDCHIKIVFNLLLHLFRTIPVTECEPAMDLRLLRVCRSKKLVKLIPAVDPPDVA